MRDRDIIPVPRQLASDLPYIPTIFTEAGQQGTWKFIEFFTASIRNPNTRAAYARAVGHFSRWCEEQGLHLRELSPFVVAGYIEHLGTTHAKPTVKQYLAALRTLFDFLVVGQIVPVNPAASVRGPKHVVKRGKTPVLTSDEARALLNSIDILTVAGLRDRALLAVMVYSFARVSAVVGMNIDDYYQQGKRYWFRLHEKGGKRHEVPAHHKAEEYLDAYIAGAGIGFLKGSPLFRTLDRSRHLTQDRIGRREVLAMVKRRARQAGISDTIGCHTFRATGITAYLLGGGTIERAAAIAAHESTRTTQLYNRTGDEISLDEIERILI